MADVLGAAGQVAPGVVDEDVVVAHDRLREHDELAVPCLGPAPRKERPARRDPRPALPVAADDELGAVLVVLGLDAPPVGRRDVFGVVGRGGVEEAEVEVLRVGHGADDPGVADVPVRRDPAPERRSMSAVRRPVLEVGADRHRQGLLRPDRPAVDVGPQPGGHLAVDVDEAPVGRIPAQQHPEGVVGRLGSEQAAGRRRHLPAQAVGGVGLLEQPAPVDLVGVGHLVAARGIGLLVVHDEVGPADEAGRARRRGKHVVPGGALELDEAEVGLLPADAVAETA